MNLLIFGAVIFACIQLFMLGQSLSSDASICASFPCRHGGICSETEDGYTCDCTSTRYHGTNCDEGPCHTIEVSNTTYAHHLDGVYYMLDSMCNSRETYRHEGGGRYLYYWSDFSEWRLGIALCVISADMAIQVYSENNEDDIYRKTMEYDGATWVTSPAKVTCILGDASICASFPCRHGGMCSETEDGYTCDCTSTRYHGTNCDEGPCHTLQVSNTTYATHLDGIYYMLDSMCNSRETYRHEGGGRYLYYWTPFGYWFFGPELCNLTVIEMGIEVYAMDNEDEVYGRTVEYDGTTWVTSPAKVTCRLGETGTVCEKLTGGICIGKDGWRQICTASESNSGAGRMSCTCTCEGIFRLAVELDYTTET